MDKNDIKPGRFIPNSSDRDYLPSIFSGQVHRYLFRVHSPISIGEASTTRISPFASTDEKRHHSYLFKESRKEAAKVLRNHLYWYANTEDTATCNLMSWTSSLLFALLFGVYLKEYRHLDYAHTNLLIVDTKELAQDGIFAKDMELIQFFVGYDKFESYDNLSTLRKLRKGSYYFGEYLSLDEVLPTRCVKVNFEDIINSHLTTIYPWLIDGTLEGKLANRVVNAREKYLTGPREHAPPLSRELVQRTMDMTQRLFGEDWAFPMSAMILGLRQVKSLSKEIVNTFTSYVSEDKMREAVSPSDLEKALDDLPEIKSYQLIVRDVLADSIKMSELATRLEATELKDEQAETTLTAEET